MFLMCRPSPRFTIFPYTTLFRSRRTLAADLGYYAPNTCEINEARGGTHAHRENRFHRSIGLGDIGRGDVRGWGTRSAEPDRKSTRLNSSHRCISYAVFCLKKKKS